MQTIMICLCLLGERLGINLRIRHFCLRTSNKRSMTLQSNECKKLNFHTSLEVHAVVEDEILVDDIYSLYKESCTQFGLDNRNP
jgi:hypothetical protein